MKNIALILLLPFLNIICNASTKSFTGDIQSSKSKRGKWCVTISNMKKERVFIANPDSGYLAISYKNSNKSGTYSSHLDKNYEGDFYKNLALLNARRELDNKHAKYVFFLPDIGIDFSDPKLEANICIWSWKGDMKNQGFEVKFYPLKYKINDDENQ